jgi:hypothetical protein
MTGCVHNTERVLIYPPTQVDPKTGNETFAPGQYIALLCRKCSDALYITVGKENDKPVFIK